MSITCYDSGMCPYGKLACVLLLSSLIVGAFVGCFGGEQDESAAVRLTPSEIVSGIQLARVGTLGDYPHRAKRLIVNVAADGSVQVGGRQLSWSGVRETLGAFSGGPQWSSGDRHLYVVLRVDRSVPWGIPARIVSICADADVDLRRIMFAVLPEEGVGEGAVAWFLPDDICICGGRCDGHERSEPREVRALRVDLVPSETNAHPVHLYSELLSEKAEVVPGGLLVASLAARAGVPTGRVLQTYDVLLRAGVDYILRSGPPLRPEGAESARQVPVSRLSSSASCWGIKLSRMFERDQRVRWISSARRTSARLPNVKRTVNGLAGPGKVPPEVLSLMDLPSIDEEEE
jgi:biopolymer transport protein ExbD